MGFWIDRIAIGAAAGYIAAKLAKKDPLIGALAGAALGAGLGVYAQNQTAISMQMTIADAVKKGGAESAQGAAAAFKL